MTRALKLSALALVGGFFALAAIGIVGDAVGAVVMNLIGG